MGEADITDGNFHRKGEMFNEMYRGDDIRPEYRLIQDWLNANGPDALNEKRAEAEALFRRVGITFAV